MRVLRFIREKHKETTVIYTDRRMGVARVIPKLKEQNDDLAVYTAGLMAAWPALHWVLHP